jgi:predicted flap endonuclease-1-like 5' DNA nuclease
VAADSDGDGLADPIDNCPRVENSDQADMDANGVGDACDMAHGPDADSDGVPDLADDCQILANPDQRDTNGDGFGNACDPDLNNDGIVNFADLAKMKSVFFKTNADADLNGDGIVNFADLARLKSQFFKAPGPSGLARRRR